jgi:tetratricopeptide (TPR) repeat protein
VTLALNTLKNLSSLDSFGKIKQNNVYYFCLILKEAVPMELQIHHTRGQNGSAMFEVIRGVDMKRTAAVSLPDPATFPVEGHPARQFLPELRWYLEDYLQTPFGVYPQLAECVTETMKAWGALVFDTLFAGYARDWYQEARRQNFEGFHIKIASDSPEIMSWPWEALYSEDDGWLALRCCIDRQLFCTGDPPSLPAASPQEAIHILYMIPRPYGENDVSYNVLANSLVEYINENNLPVTVDILRPPTFDQLRKVLYDHPNYYNIVHFDGHGGYGAVVDTPAGNLYAAPEGQLVFETDSGKPDPVDTRLLAQLLAEYHIPFVVMNACQSGMIDGQAKDPFASVAAGLLKAGVRSVVAMGYSLYVSGARAFIPAFYERLFSTGRVSEAVRAGRGNMLRQSDRDCVVGKLPLQDWTVPVLYQQLSSESAVLPKPQSVEGSGEEASPLPEYARVDGDYGFIGRGRDIQRLERAMLRQPQAAILIHGQAGVGKTSLAKGFLRWQSQTGGLWRDIFWFNFQEIHSAEYVINQLLDKLAGTAALASPAEEKQELLTQLLRDRPCLLVWDNFESASGIEGTEIQPQLGTEDREILARLLKGLRYGKTKILITSRSKEKWLTVQSCYSLPLDGLSGEDLWEYCNAVVRDLGLTLDRDNETYIKILDRLCGNPLAIRSILLRLQNCSAKQLLSDLESNFEGTEGDEGTRRLQAAYAVFGSSLTERYLPVLQVTGLHEYYANTDLIKAMLNGAGCPMESDMIHSCYHILENAGFCTHIGQNTYKLHPALRGYLLRQIPAPVPVQRGFVDIMGRRADALTGKTLYQVQVNIANFYYARQLADVQDMDNDYMALTQSLAHYAEELCRFAEANKLCTTLIKKAKEKDDWQTLAKTFHQLGRIAQSQWDIYVAEGWYKKAIEIEEVKKYEHDAAMTYHQMGTISDMRQDFVSANEWYQKALTIFKEQKDEYCMACTYYQLGKSVQEQGNSKIAKKWYEKARTLFEKQENNHFIACIEHQLGIISQVQGNFKAAENCYKRALEVFEEQKNKQRAALTYYQLGINTRKCKDVETANKWFKKALAINEEQGNEYDKATTYRQFGIIAQEYKDFVSAEAWYKKALEISEKRKYDYDIAKTYYQLGKLSFLNKSIQNTTI